MPRTLTAHPFSSVDGAMGRHLMHGHDDVQRLELVDHEVTERGDLLLTYRPHARH
ncbi:hypothetical protein [Propioniciclava sinopodophylli]|uniref:hypothetical protein n=1 Tax=Propioniciclava sinopodophylli TaxID=1837344 RepID=UPI002493971E|nr:hypothetical protein [Propioniciclava sinopodophylli]